MDRSTINHDFLHVISCQYSHVKDIDFVIILDHIKTYIQENDFSRTVFDQMVNSLICISQNLDIKNSLTKELFDFLNLPKTYFSIFFNSYILYLFHNDIPNASLFSKSLIESFIKENSNSSPESNSFSIFGISFLKDDFFEILSCIIPSFSTSDPKILSFIGPFINCLKIPKNLQFQSDNIDIISSEFYSRLSPEILNYLYANMPKENFISSFIRNNDKNCQIILEKLSNMDDASFFMTYLDKTDSILSESSISSILQKINSSEEAIKYLHPHLQNPLLKSGSYWRHIASIITENDINKVLPCFLYNSNYGSQNSMVAERCLDILDACNGTENITKEICAFISVALSDTSDLLDFNFSKRLLNILINLKSMPIISFWKLTSCDHTFLRIPNFFSGEYPYALLGFVYNVFIHKTASDTSFLKKITIPKLTEDEEDEVMKFLDCKINNVDDLFKPFTTNERAIHFYTMILLWTIRLVQNRSNEDFPLEELDDQYLLGISISNLIFPFIDNDAFFRPPERPISELSQFFIKKESLSLKEKKCLTKILNSKHPFYDTFQIIKHLWEIQDVYEPPEFRTAYALSLQYFLGMSNFNKLDNISTFLGRKIIPFLLGTQFPETEHYLFKLDSNSFWNIQKQEKFSHFCGGFPFYKVIPFLSLHTTGAPQFTVDNADLIAATLRHSYGLPTNFPFDFNDIVLTPMDQCAFLSFLIDNNCFDALSLDKEEEVKLLLNIISLIESDDILSIKHTLQNIILNEEAQIYSVYYQLLLNSSSDIELNINCIDNICKCQVSTNILKKTIESLFVPVRIINDESYICSLKPFITPPAEPKLTIYCIDLFIKKFLEYYCPSSPLKIDQEPSLALLVCCTFFLRQYPYLIRMSLDDLIKFISIILSLIKNNYHFLQNNQRSTLDLNIQQKKVLICFIALNLISRFPLCIDALLIILRDRFDDLIALQRYIILTMIDSIAYVQQCSYIFILFHYNFHEIVQKLFKSFYDQKPNWNQQEKEELQKYIKSFDMSDQFLYLKMDSKILKIDLIITYKACILSLNLIFSNHLFNKNKIKNMRVNYVRVKEFYERLDNQTPIFSLILKNLQYSNIFINLPLSNNIFCQNLILTHNHIQDLKALVFIGMDEEDDYDQNFGIEDMTPDEYLKIFMEIPDLKSLINTEEYIKLSSYQQQTYIENIIPPLPELTLQMLYFVFSQPKYLSSYVEQSEHYYMNAASLLQLFRLRKTLIAMKNNTNPEVDIKLSDGMIDNFIKLEDLHIPTHFPDSGEIINKFLVNQVSLSIFFNLSEIFKKNKESFFSSKFIQECIFKEKFVSNNLPNVSMPSFIKSILSIPLNINLLYYFIFGLIPLLLQPENLHNKELCLLVSNFILKFPLPYPDLKHQAAKDHYNINNIYETIIALCSHLWFIGDKCMTAAINLSSILPPPRTPFLDFVKNTYEKAPIYDQARICQLYPEISPKNYSEFLNRLQSLISNYRPANVFEIGILLDVLSPPDHSFIMKPQLIQIPSTDSSNEVHSFTPYVNDLFVNRRSSFIPMPNFMLTNISNYRIDFGSFTGSRFRLGHTSNFILEDRSNIISEDTSNIISEDTSNIISEDTSEDTSNTTSEDTSNTTSEDTSKMLEISDLFSLSELNEPIPLAISPSLYYQAKEFWDILVEYRDKITQIIRAHPNELFSNLIFFSKYPIINDIDLKIKFLSSSGSIKPIPCSLHIDRHNIIEDSVRELNSHDISVFSHRIIIHFKGEQGSDEGGLSRDWFQSVSDILFNHIQENYAQESDTEALELFKPTPNGMCVMFNPSFHVTPHARSLIAFSAKFIALAIINEKLINAHLTSALFKHIMNVKLNFHDLEQVDEAAYNSLKEIMLVKDPDELRDYELTFSVGDYELCPGGASRAVTMENRSEYVRLVAEYYLYTCAKEQIDIFVTSFKELIPMHKLRIFTPEELDLVICGTDEIDIEDFKRNCVLVHPYNQKHPVILMFWKVIKTLEKQDMGRFLRFVTGSSQIPVGGFRGYANRGIPFTITPGGSGNRLPQAHTCSNQLDLPEYTNRSEMRAKILFAIRNTSGFGFI